MKPSQQLIPCFGRPNEKLTPGFESLPKLVTLNPPRALTNCVNMIYAVFMVIFQDKAVAYFKQRKKQNGGVNYMLESKSKTAKLVGINRQQALPPIIESCFIFKDERLISNINNFEIYSKSLKETKKSAGGFLLNI